MTIYFVFLNDGKGREWDRGAKMKGVSKGRDTEGREGRREKKEREKWGGVGKTEESREGIRKRRRDNRGKGWQRK